MDSQAPEPSSPVTPYDLAPYDAVLLLSFGGPEAPEQVMPFLENVTRGRGIPRERLEEVAEHYLHLGGRSPINDQNRALLGALRGELDRRGATQSVHWGNRNWDPYLTDALRRAHDDGARRVLAVTTSAYSSYSGCRQYREDLAAAVATLAAEGRELDVDKVRPFFNMPGFTAEVVDGVVAVLRRLAADEVDGDAVRLVFVTHSLPMAMAQASGPVEAGAYVAQHRDVATTVVAGVAGQLDGRSPAWDLVYCSRSGPPSQPWLEPDVNDRLETLAAEGVRAVVLVPVGFISDHMEVVYDLDTEAAATASRLGLRLERLATVGTERRFVAGLVDLMVERAAQRRGEPVTAAIVGSLPASPSVCAAACCPNLRGARPALCQQSAAASALQDRVPAPTEVAR